MVNRFGYRMVMGVGLALVLVALTGLTQLQIDSQLWVVLGGFFLFGLGMGSVIAPATSMMQNVLPLARAGAGSAVQNTVRQVAGALGIAIVGTVLGTQYATHVVETFKPLGPEFPSSQASESVVATDVALSAAEQQGVPPGVVEPIRDQAYDVFLNAAHTTMILSAVVVLVALLLVLFVLPYVRPPREGDASPEDTWDEGEAATERAVLAEQGRDDEPDEGNRGDGTEHR